MVVANNTMVVALTVNEMLCKGLLLVGFDKRRQDRVQQKTNMERFRTFYSSNPIVFVKIWEDLQTTEILEARIHAAKHSCDNLLMAAYFLKCYPTETLMAGAFCVAEKTAPKWVWFFAAKIQALKKSKVHDCCCFNASLLVKLIPFLFPFRLFGAT